MEPTELRASIDIPPVALLDDGRGKDFPDRGIRWNEISCFFQETGCFQDTPFRDERANLVLDF